jgi:hypothetical protein
MRYIRIGGGLPLARGSTTAWAPSWPGVELQETLRGLLGRLPGLALAVPAADLRFKPGMAIYNLRELPLTWDQA